jgi:hypothetical protein
MFVHVTSQLPQLLTLLRSDSQPFLASVSQSPKLLSHVGEHKPAEHVATPWALLHDCEQLPQVAVTSDVLASQPLIGSPSQSA